MVALTTDTEDLGLSRDTSGQKKGKQPNLAYYGKYGDLLVVYLAKSLKVVDPGIFH